MDPKPPTKPTLDGLERKWADRWARSGVYRFDRTRPRAEVFSIDTPPPTVSGNLHLGHAFSYTQTDVVARFQRMRGRAVFYPMGWDDNGLPTERRVQQHFGVRCDLLPYRPAFEPPEWPSRQPIAVSRPNFVELCSQLTMEDEQAFEAVFRRLGLSVDWSLTYATIGERPGGPPSGRSCACWPGAGLPGRRPDPVGGGLPHRRRPGRAGGPRGRGHVLPPAVPQRAGGRHDPARAPAGLRRPGRPPRRRPLHGPAGDDRADPAVRGRGAGAGLPARRPRQGHRHRHALHLRRPDRPHLVARAGRAHAAGAEPGRHHPAGHLGLIRVRERRPGGRPAGPRPAGRPARGPPGNGRRPCCARPAPWPRRRPASPRRSSSTSTAASRWRS